MPDASFAGGAASARSAVTARTEDRPSHIGTLNERPLHAALKRWAAEDGDRFEVPVGRYVADILRGEEVIEIQTGSTAVLKQKLATLLGHRAVRLLLPVAAKKTIVTLDEDGVEARSRLSPRRGSLVDAVRELVSLRAVLGDPNLSVDVVLIHEEEVRRPRRGRAGRWQRDWEVQERKLIEVIDCASLRHPADYLAFVPAALAEPFTTADLCRAIERPRRTAQQVAYVLREMGVLDAVGKRGNAILYERHFGHERDTTD